MSNEKAQTWQYKTRKEQAASAAITLATGTAYVWCLSQVFNPLALGAAAAYTGYGITKKFLLPALSDKYRQKLIKDALKKEHYLPAHNKKNIETIVAELSHDMGLSYTPSVYFFGDKAIPELMSFYGRLNYDLQRSDRQKELRQNLKDNFSADSIHKTITTTPEALAKIDNKHLRAVLGHEVAHLKTRDSYSADIIGANAINLTNRALFYASIFTEPVLLALPLIHRILKRTKKLWNKTIKKQDGIMKAKDQQLTEQYGEEFFEKSGCADLHPPKDNEKEETESPISYAIASTMVFFMIYGATLAPLALLSQSPLAMIGIFTSLTILPYAAKTGLLCLSRHFEQRADRNGLYHTQSLNDCITDPYRNVLNQKETTPISKFLSLPITHPEPFERVAILKEAWEKIKKLPPPTTKETCALQTEQPTAPKFR